MKTIWEIMESVTNNDSFPGDADYTEYNKELVSVRKDEHPEFGQQLVWRCGKLLNDNRDLIERVYAGQPIGKRVLMNMVGLSLVISRNRYGHYEPSLCIHCESSGGIERVGNIYLPKCGNLGQFGNEKQAKSVSYRFFKRLSDGNKFTDLLELILQSKFPINMNMDF